MSRRSVFAALSVASAVAAAFAQNAPVHGPLLVTEADVVWGPGPPSLPKGAMMARLSGDPSRPGPFTARVKFPPGFVLPPHRHGTDEHVTVMSGTVLAGHGERLDRSATRALTAGAFSLMPQGTAHYSLAPEGAVIQVHGTGPFTVTYVDPDDDPRNAPAAK